MNKLQAKQLQAIKNIQSSNSKFQIFGTCNLEFFCKLKLVICNFKRKGFTLIELVLSISLFVIIAAGVAVPVIGNYLSGLENAKNTKANAVLTETWEAVRSIRNRDWADMTNQTHGLRNTSGYWEFYGMNDLTDGFTRSVIVKNAKRDANGNLVQEGVQDPDSKLVKVQISWQPTPYRSQILEAESLLTNYLNPSSWPL